MTLIVKLAQSEDEVDALFRGRHRVFAETDAYMAANDESRFYDRYDSYPTTANFIALDQQEVIGGLRFTEQSSVGTAPEATFDFGYYLPPTGEIYGTGSWLFLDRDYRNSTSVTYCLWALAYAWAQERDWSKLLCVANPAILPSLLQHGFRQLGEIRVDPRKKLPFVPIMRDLRELDPAMQSLVTALQQRRRAQRKGVELRLPRLAPRQARSRAFALARAHDETKSTLE